MRDSHLRQILTAAVCLLVLGGCQAGTPIATVIPIPPSASPTVVPTATSTATPTPTITPTPVPPPLPSVFEGHLPAGAYAILGLGEIVAVDLSPDGEYLAVLTGIGLGVYKAKDLELVWFEVVQMESSCFGMVRWSPDGSRIAIGTCSDAMIWDFQTAQEHFHLNRLEVYKHPYGHWDNIAWSLDGLILAVSGDDSKENLFWNTSTGNIESAQDTATPPKFGLAKPKDSVTSLDGSTIIFVDQNRVVLQDTETKEEIKTVHQIVGTAVESSESVAWSADGNMLAVQSGCVAGRICIPETIDVWDFHSATLLSRYNEDTLSGFEFNYEFSEESPDGTRSLTYFLGGGTMTLLNVDTNRPVRELKMYDECEGPCLRLAWSPDSQRLAATLAPGLYIWDAHTGERIKYSAPYPFAYSLAFSPDSKFLATAAGGAVIVWEVP